MDVYQKDSRSEILVVCITILLDVLVPEPCLQRLSAVAGAGQRSQPLDSILRRLR